MKYRFIINENSTSKNYYKMMYLAGKIYMQKLNSFKEEIKQQDGSINDTSIFKDIKFI